MNMKPRKITKTDKKKLAQDLIMRQIAIIGYGDKYNDFVDIVGNQEEADAIMLEQMDRIAKMFGYEGAWFE